MPGSPLVSTATSPRSAEALVAEEPLRERRWAVLAARAVPLWAAGRRAAHDSPSPAHAGRAARDRARRSSWSSWRRRSCARTLRWLAAGRRRPTVATECPVQGPGCLRRRRRRDVLRPRRRDRRLPRASPASPLLVVAGPSGCGKSSLVRAGLVPALQRQRAIGGGVRPRLRSGHGADRAMLASAERRAGRRRRPVRGALHPCDDVATRPRGSAGRLAVYASRPGAGGGRAFGPITSPASRSMAASPASPNRACTSSARSTGDASASRDRATRRPGRAPARSRASSTCLVRDTEGEPGALPLLSHALAETWRRRDGQRAHRRRLPGHRRDPRRGRPLRRPALREPAGRATRRCCVSMLLRLVTPSRRWRAGPFPGRPLPTLVGDRRPRAGPRLLVRARLVTAEADTVELAHEALARAWPRLRSWLDEDAAGQRMLAPPRRRRRPAGTASAGRTSELYRGARLDSRY